MNLLVCGRCSARLDEPVVGRSGDRLDCPECGHAQHFRRLPLWCLTGPSGTGKSTVARRLLDELADDFVVLEQDVLWQAGLRDDGGEHRAFRSAWLRMAAMVHQSGRPVVLVGTVVPPEFEPLPERVLFDGIHYLGLDCESGPLAERLRARPAWRGWDEERIAETLDFAAWIHREAAAMEPPMILLDTTHVTIEDTTAAVVDWVRSRAG